LIALFKTAIEKGRTTAGVPQQNHPTHFSGLKWNPLTVFDVK